MSSLTLDLNDPATLLAWYVAMGADDAVLDEPQDRFALTKEIAAAPAPTPTTSAPSAKKTATPKPVAARPTQPMASVNTAQKAADNAGTLAELKKALEGIDGGTLKSTATNTVFADGVVGAPLMVIGDAPGAEEDKNGKPFMGVEGALLDKMLAAISFSRLENAYLSCLVPWRPLGNRRPDPQTVALCLPFLLRHIELAKPKAVLVLGGTTASALFNNDQNIAKLRGDFHDISAGSHEIAAIATYQPAYLIKQPRFKADAWRDLLAVKAKLESK